MSNFSFGDSNMRNVCVILVAVLMTACGEPTTPPGPFPPGTYNLAVVDGQPVPVQLVPGLTITSGEIVILADNQFTAKTCYRGWDTNPCQLSRWEQGQYTRDGNNVTLATIAWSRFLRDDGTLDSLPNHYIRTLAIRGTELVQNGGGDFAGHTLTYVRD